MTLAGKLSPFVEVKIYFLSISTFSLLQRAITFQPKSLKNSSEKSALCYKISEQLILGPRTVTRSNQFGFFPFALFSSMEVNSETRNSRFDRLIRRALCVTVT